MRECTKCHKLLPITDYHVNKSRKDGRRADCKYCVTKSSSQWQKKKYTSKEERFKRTLRRHKLTAERFEQQLIAQNYACAICKREDIHLYVDHDHNCCAGKTSCGYCFRGLLCHACNIGLGSFKDSYVLLMEAVNYLDGGYK